MTFFQISLLKAEFISIKHICHRKFPLKKYAGYEFRNMVAKRVRHSVFMKQYFFLIICDKTLVMEDQ